MPTGSFLFGKLCFKCRESFRGRFWLRAALRQAGVPECKVVDHNDGRNTTRGLANAMALQFDLLRKVVS